MYISCEKQWNVEFSIIIKWGQIILEKNVKGAKNIYIDTKNRKMEVTRKSCSETNTKAALRYRSTTILKLFAPKS